MFNGQILGSQTSLQKKILTMGLALMILIAVRFVLRGFYIWRAYSAGDPTPVVDYFFDDAYFYLTIAKNFANTGVSTFDGTTLTNGYQPLWFLIVSGLSWLTGGHPFPLFALVSMVVYGIAICTLTTLYKLSASENESIMTALPFGVSCALAYSGTMIFFEGLETVLMLPLAVWLFALLKKREFERDAIQFSIVFSLMFLARLDSIAISLSTVLFYLADGWKAVPTKHLIRTAMKMTSVFICTCLTYFLLNYAIFDIPVPVSGLAKGTGGPKFHNWGIIIEFWPVFLLLAYFFLAMKIAHIKIFHAVGAKELCTPILVFSAALGIQYLYYATQSTWPIWPWYKYIAYLLLAFSMTKFCTLVIKEEFGECQRFSWIVVVTLFSITSFQLSISVILDARHQYANNKSGTVREVNTFNEMTLRQLVEFTPKKGPVVVAMGDRSGGLGFWGGERVKVVQTEGLVMDSAYLKARQRGVGAEYLESRFNIDYFIVDREVIPSYQARGEKVYIVTDPIQGRVTNEKVPTFCFPEHAVKYQNQYVLWKTSKTERVVFSFSDRIACGPEASAYIESVAKGIGLRQMSIPVSYTSLDRAVEDFDRAWGAM